MNGRALQAAHDQARQAEFTRRHQALVRALQALGLRRALFCGAESIFYLTGASYQPLERPFFLLLDVDRPGYRLLVPLLEARHLRKAWGVTQEGISTYREFPAPAGEQWSDRLAQFLDQPFVFEPATPHATAERLLAAGGRALDLLEPIRIVKSDWEVAQIARAARHADLGVQRLLKAAYRGASVAEGGLAVRGLLTQMIRELPELDWAASHLTGATWPAPLSAEPHAIPPLGLRMGEGPHVALVLTRINGYAAECERTFFTAPPSREQRERFALMLEARRRALALVRPGQSCAAIDAEVNAFLGSQGWGPRMRLHRTGHGLGLGNHEPPWLAEGSEHVLAANMVISIEPGLYETGVGGWRHSDTILVTPEGARPLTHAPDQLADLVLGRASLVQWARGQLVRRMLGLD